VPQCCQTNFGFGHVEVSGVQTSRCSSFTTTVTLMAYVQVEADDVSPVVVSLIRHNCLPHQPIATSRRRSRRSPVQMYARFLVHPRNPSNLTAPIAFLGADASAHGISNPPSAPGVGNTDRRKSRQLDTHRRELMFLEFRIYI
jgi:hypothetical protein